MSNLNSIGVGSSKNINRDVERSGHDDDENDK
jgi:hypothetical protein